MRRNNFVANVKKNLPYIGMGAGLMVALLIVPVVSEPFIGLVHSGRVALGAQIEGAN